MDSNNLFAQKILVFFFISLVIFLPIQASEFIEYKGHVVKVSDGDSLTILIEKQQIRIRLAEIDAPERGQPGWIKSKDALAELVAGKNVIVHEHDIDRYGRIVGHVYVDEVWVNAELIKQGWVYVYPKYAVTQILYEYEEASHTSKLGLWGFAESERLKPWDYRKMQRTSPAK